MIEPEGSRADRPTLPRSCWPDGPWPAHAGRGPPDPFPGPRTGMTTSGAETSPANSGDPSRDHPGPRLIVGLGNPGSRYGNTRHNVGVWTVNLLARQHGVQLERHGQIDRASLVIDGQRVVLARPRAFMNACGPPVARELRRLGLTADSLLVIYDDLDLPVGRLRLRRAGSHGGNNGMRSLISALGTGEFGRARIGIDRPYEDGRGVRDPEQIARWVLSRPAAAERLLLDGAVERAAEAVQLAVREGLETAMAEFNRTLPGEDRTGAD